MASNLLAMSSDLIEMFFVEFEYKTKCTPRYFLQYFLLLVASFVPSSDARSP